MIGLPMSVNVDTYCPRGGRQIGMILRWSKEKRGLGSGNNCSMSMADLSVPCRTRISIRNLCDQVNWSSAQTYISFSRDGNATEPFLQP